MSAFLSFYVTEQLPLFLLVLGAEVLLPLSDHVEVLDREDCQLEKLSIIRFRTTDGKVGGVLRGK